MKNTIFKGLATLGMAALAFGFAFLFVSGRERCRLTAELRLKQAPANNACSASVDVEPDGAATQAVGEVAAPPARPMDCQSPQRRRQTHRHPQR